VKCSGPGAEKGEAEKGRSTYNRTRSRASYSLTSEYLWRRGVFAATNGAVLLDGLFALSRKFLIFTEPIAVADVAWFSLINDDSPRLRSAPICGTILGVTGRVWPVFPLSLNGVRHDFDSSHVFAFYWHLFGRRPRDLHFCFCGNVFR